MRMGVHGHRRLLLLIIRLVVSGTILASGLGGCGGEGAIPNVVINAPPNNSEARLGEAVPIHSTATHATGVTKTELWVDDALYTSGISPVAQGESPLSVTRVADEAGGEDALPSRRQRVEPRELQWGRAYAA